MRYIAYGAQQPESIKVMTVGDVSHIRITRNYQEADSNDKNSSAQWEETYQQINASEAPTKEQVASDEETWWNRGIYWEELAFSPTINERISAIESVLLSQILGETT